MGVAEKKKKTKQHKGGLNHRLPQQPSKNPSATSRSCGETGDLFFNSNFIYTNKYGCKWHERTRYDMKKYESTAKSDYTTYSRMDMLVHKYTLKKKDFYYRQKKTLYHEEMSHSAEEKKC